MIIPKWSMVLVVFSDLNINPHCLNFWLLLASCKFKLIGNPVTTNFVIIKKVYCSSILEMANICRITEV